MEREVSRIYNEAYDDISKKWNAYMKSHTAKVENALIALQKAIESGDQDRIKKAREYYVHTVKNVTVNNERFRSMRDETVAKISHTNEIALDYLNGNMASVYTVNYNAFSTEKVAGYSFALVNEQAIKELATTDKMLLPKKKVNIPKDEAWNKKLINSQMLQGILQGESIPKIAKRLRNVTNMNRVSAIRNARTMTTSAENKGRQDSFEKAQSDGVIMEREWIPAHDDRTRAWHLELGGVRVGVDEPWENEYGKIMYPGDPGADPANVYNCRCAIRARVKGFDWSKSEKQESQTKFENTHEVIQGKDISNTWQRRPDKFDFEIEDVINAQGFDGLPRVVSTEEFDRAVNKSNIIMQRGYTAPNQETLMGYEKELYDGKWYVDCSKGAAQYGKGMYSVYTDGKNLTDEMISAAENYAGGGGLKVGKIETFTLTEDSRIIDYDDLLKEQAEWNKNDKYFDLASPYARSEEEKAYIIYNSGGRKVLSDEQLEMARVFDNNITEQRYYELEDVIKTIRNTRIDTSEYAVMKGYDAIKVKKNNYAIILNRTKCIFKGE